MRALGERIRGRRGAPPRLGFAAACAVAVASPASAQDTIPSFGGGPSRAGPVLDSLRLDVEWRPTWRGFLMGSGGVRLLADVGLAGYPTTASGEWGLAAHLAAAEVFDERAPALSDGHVAGGLTVFRYFRGGRTALGLVADAYTIFDADSDADGVEIGLRATGIEWAWGLEEVNPTLEVGVYRDVGRFDGFRADLGFDLGFGVQNVAPWIFTHTSAWLEADVGWTEYDRDRIGRADFSGRLGLGVALERGAFAVSASFGALDPFDAGLRAYADLGLRFWPDARE